MLLVGFVIATWPVAPSIASSTSTTTPSATSFRLQAIDFTTPSHGLGVFETESANYQTCHNFVGKTTDGGATFVSLVPVVTTRCTNFDFGPSLVSDGYGDDFLYGPRLYVSHDNAKSWIRSPDFGSVLDIDAVGPSVWLLESQCTQSQSARGAPCTVRLYRSTNGGRSWGITSKAFARGFNGLSNDPPGQSYLVRITRSSGYLMLAPSSSVGGQSVAPLWFTSNGGVTWLKRDVPCDIGAFYSVLSVDASGTLMAACASQPSAGSQMKSVLLSSDGGRHWTLKTDSNINVGYLGQIELINNEVAFMVGGRSSLLETRDGGTRWRAVNPLIGGSAGGTSQVTFPSPTHGLVLGNDDADNEAMTLWRTANGGRNWSLEIPAVR